jgi:hypothetical protein
MALKNRGTTGVLPYGVRKVARSSRYAAAVSCGGRYFHLGVFDTAEEAHRVAVKAKQRLHSEAKLGGTT